MAPIDPKLLLDAFKPLLTQSGGIKNATEVPRLSSLMKKFSKKLVSRCIYVNVLLSTEPDVLEAFLANGGWGTIHTWINGCKEMGNNPFLIELLKLLLILPMTVDRLKENDTPKIIKSLAKNDNLIIAEKSKEVVDKWMMMITGGATNVDKDEKKEKDHKKKRKKDSIETNKVNHNNGQANDLNIKRVKIDDNLSDENNSQIKNNNDMLCDVIPIVEESNRIEKPPRPVTSKVKLGKSRLDGLITNNVNTNNNSLKSKGSKLLLSKVKPTLIQSNSSPINKLTIGLNDTNSIVVKNAPSVVSSENKPKPEIKSPLMPTTPPPIVKPHLLQDSAGFMDALIAPQSTSSVKKKPRRTSGANSTNSNKDSDSDSTGKSASPKITFYKDTLDDRVELNDNDRNSFDDDTEENESSNDNECNAVTEDEVHMNVDIPDIDVNVNAINIESLPTINKSHTQLKSILSLGKKSQKRSIQWVEDSQLQQIRYFELDETERVNVTRSAESFSDMKRFDMKHEKTMLLARRCGGNVNYDIGDDANSRVQNHGKWMLIPIDIPPEMSTIEYGKDSNERIVQADRVMTMLESIFPRDKLPESPSEPDYEVFSASEPFKVIPLEDDNNPNNVHDFSTTVLPKPKTGEVLPSRFPDFANISASQNSSMGFGHSNVTAPFQQLNAPSQFAMNSPFSVSPMQQSEHFPRSQGSQFFTPPPRMQQWSNDNMNSHFTSGGIPPHSSSVPRGLSIRGPNLAPHSRGPNTKQICRHFLKNGSCRFQNRCTFLHQQR